MTMSSHTTTNNIDNRITSKTMEIPLTTPIHYTNVPGRASSLYPTLELQSLVHGRMKRSIGNMFGITNFGMNITTIQPNGTSSIVHYHTNQDEMIYIISGTATLTLYYDTNNDANDANQKYKEIQMSMGESMGFPAGRKVGHSIRNTSNTEPLIMIEIGDRTPADTAIYPEPNIDLYAAQPQQQEQNDSKPPQYQFYHKDGRPYE
jgi:uncharacterized cupin superfamily protein